MTDFDFRFVSQYAADAAIILPSGVSPFTTGKGFSGYGVFDNQIGTASVRLGPGTYHLAVRNQSQTSNQIRYELDLALSLLAEQGPFVLVR
ncbi:MAG: hypothetical protein ACRENP_05230 [Longimicrobiales bacterium]